MNSQLIVHVHVTFVPGAGWNDIVPDMLVSVLTLGIVFTGAATTPLNAGLFTSTFMKGQVYVKCDTLILTL